MLPLLLLGLLALLLSRCSTDDDDTTGVSAGAAPTAASAGSVPGSSPAATTDPAATAGSTTTPGLDAGRLVVGGTDLLAGPATATGSLASYAEQSAEGADVVVESVPADEGFWVGTSTDNRVWVQLSGAGESGYQVKQGDHVDFTGSVIKNSADFAASAGVSAADGAEQLTAQGVHVQVEKSAIALHQ